MYVMNTNESTQWWVTQNGMENLGKCSILEYNFVEKWQDKWKDFKLLEGANWKTP